jgi:hypothetical protein
MKPKDRVTFLQDKFKRDLIKIEKVLAGQPFELIGTKRKPRGVKIKTNSKTFKLLKNLSFISLISTDKKGKEKAKKEVSYFCFKAIFQAQVEGQTTGNQTIEERFLLVKSNNRNKAEKAVRRESKDYEKPYLNPYGQMVRWTLESIEDSYQTYITDKEDFSKPLEIFSKWKRRRLKKGNVWNGD